VAIVVYPLGDGIELAVDVADDSSSGEAAILTLFVAVVLAVAVAVTWGGYYLVRAVLRRLSVGIGTIVALVLIVACIAVIIVDGYENNSRATVGPVFTALLILALCILVTGMGGGALISWASRLAVRNASAIGHMASIALPVILMLVVFAFFSAEVWQMASALHWGSIALVGLVVAILAGIVVMRVSASEIDDEAQTPTEVQRRALLVGTPAEHRQSTAGHQPLRAPQRFNILLAMTFAQLVQALFFALLLAALLIVIGSIAIPVGVIEIWLGPGSESQPLAVEPLMIAGATLPITVNLLKAAMLLSLIAALPFVFSAVSEARYRERFFDPIMADMRRAILVRDALAAKAPH
jgi:MFS family permease